MATYTDPVCTASFTLALISFSLYISHCCVDHFNPMFWHPTVDIKFSDSTRLLSNGHDFKFVLKLMDLILFKKERNK